MIPIPVFRFVAGALVDANDAAWRVLGFASDGSRDALSTALDPDRLLPALFARLGPDAAAEPLRHEARRRDGGVCCLDLHVGPEDDQCGRVVAAYDCTRWHGVEAQLQRRLAFERLLTGASARLIRARGGALDDAIVDVLGSVGAFFEVDRAYVFLVDDAAGTQSNTHEWVAPGISREAHNLQDVPLDTFPWLMQGLRADKAFEVPRVADLPPEAVNERAEFEREGIRSILVVPLWQGAALHGFVGFDAVRRHVDWGEHFVVGLRLMAQMVASALEARTLADRLHDQAFRDPLTGLPNRKLLEDRFSQAAGRLQRKGAGTVSRMGGDEFVVLAEECGPDALSRLADRLLAAGDAPIEVDGQTLQVGLSIGIARGGAPTDGLDGLLRAADAAMYQAKAEGKHRWLEAARLG